MSIGIKIPVRVPDNCPQCSQPTKEMLPFCSRCGYDLRHLSYVKKGGKCIYCNAASKISTGELAKDVSLTKEHVFGNWLANRYPSEKIKPTVQRLRRPDIVEVFSDRSPEMHVRDIERKEGNYQLKVRNVCGDCNNGWMSRLHIEARTIVQSLADGQSPVFTLQALEILCRWAIMVSVNLECHAHMLETIDYHLVDLMQGRMPKGWRVYIGQLPTNKHANFNQTRVVGTSIQIEADVYQMVKNTAFCIEHVIFNTVSTNGGDAMLHLARYSVDSLNYPHPLTCIWDTRVQPVPQGINKVDDSIINYIDSFS